MRDGDGDGGALAAQLGSRRNASPFQDDSRADDALPDGALSSMQEWTVRRGANACTSRTASPEPILTTAKPMSQRRLDGRR